MPVEITSILWKIGKKDEIKYLHQEWGNELEQNDTYAGENNDVQISKYFICKVN